MKLIKAAVLSLLLSLAIPQANADQTNVVQNVSIQLWGVKSNGTVRSHGIVTTGVARAVVNTRHIINALGVATGNTFSNSSRLVIVTPLGGGESAIQVRDTTHSVDVTAFFSHQQLGDAVSGSESNRVTHRSVDFDFSIQRLTLHDAEGFPALGLHFDVSGYSSETTAAHHRGVGKLQIEAAGTGDAGGTLMILRGEVDVRGDRLEVVTGGGGEVS